MQALLQSISALNPQILALDGEIAEISKQDATCQRLMSVPGVGPITALRFCSALDDANRFANASDVGAYLGLTPGEHSSGQKKRRTHISKAGSAAVRRVLVQAAWCMLRTRPQDPMVRWALQIAERRGKAIAAVALARKLAGLLYVLCKHQTFYHPEHSTMTPSLSQKVA